MRFWFTLEISIKELMRQPMYMVTTMIFPSMFFWFFAVPNANSVEAAKVLTGSFAGFAVLAVMLFQLAVQTSFERGLAWSQYIRCLPLSGIEVLLGRVIASLLLSILAILLVIFTGVEFTVLSWSDVATSDLLITLVIAGLPFAAMGICIGYVTNGKSALPIANLIYLPLSFAGGLWLPPNALPVTIQNISNYLPTRLYRNCIESILFEHEIANRDIQGLLIYLLIFTALAVVLYRKQEHSFKI